MISMVNFKDKKVLVVGLGVLGGGVATTRWLVCEGAQVTVTDLRTPRELKNSLEELGKDIQKIQFVLGRHDLEDFKNHDIVVVGPGVKVIGNKFLEAARRAKKPTVNDLEIFLGRAKNKVVAVTGTRGKTTTTNWIAHFLRSRYRGVKASGNSSRDAFLKLLPRLQKKEGRPAVLELSSFQLEVLEKTEHAPDVAVLTNIYKDHLNRHGSMKEYARVKGNIFKFQKRNQKLILNLDNAWTKFFLSMKPKSGVHFTSLKKLPKGKKGVFVSDEKIFFCDGRKTKKVVDERGYEKLLSLGKHNVYNFLSASLAAHLLGVSWKKIEKRISTLPQVEFREEVVLERRGLRVINDTTATSPEGAIAALERFGGKETFFIAGGTDKGLEYDVWAKRVKENISPENLYLLDGSATKKMVRELKKIRYFGSKKTKTYKTLEEIVKKASKNKKGVIVFSPGAASFEKFKNEFDRGEKFNTYLKRIFR